VVPKQDRAIGVGVRRVVIVGNGVAGTSVAEALRRDSASVEITVVGNEPHPFYNRMGIGRLVYDREGMASLRLVPDDWARAQRVELMMRTVAAQVDRGQHRLGLAGGRWLEYDRLVLATGARATLPTPDFLEHPNAFVLRSADDAESIRDHVQRAGARRALVLGGGVLGVEAADALHKLGLRVTLLQRAGRLMNAQLDERGAALLTHYLESIGIQVVTGVAVARWEGAPALTTAWLEHGPRVRADLFVACLGIQANVHLAAQAGLPVRQGILVDAAMRTADPHVFAVGDCAELPGVPRGLWPIGAAQAAVAAESIWGGEARFEPGQPMVQLKCDGIDLRSVGEVEPRAGDEVFEALRDDAAWWHLILREGRLAGALFVGPPGSSKPFVRLLQEPETLMALRPRLRRGDLLAAAAATGLRS
jgi:NAD(P)H-nitrite reductase large subunit